MPRKTKIVLALVGLMAVVLTAFGFALRRGMTINAALTASRDFFLLILELVGIALLLALTVSLFRWLRRKPEGTLIMAFETVDGGEKESKPKFDGKSISDSLNRELLRILEIHLQEEDLADFGRTLQSVTSRQKVANAEGMRAQSAVDRPKANILFQGRGLKTATENLTPSFADSVTVGVGGATVSIGRLLLAFKQISSSRDPDIIISGSLQRYGKLARLIARIQRCGQPLLVCEVSRPIDSEDQIPDLIRDLAYIIWHETSKAWQEKPATSANANTWTAFKHFTEALYGTQQYSVTGRIEDLQEAAANCLAAVNAERAYQNLFYLCYNVAGACFEQGEYDKAQDLFLGAIDIYEGTALEGEAKNRIADAFNGYGASLAWQGKHTDAERAYRQAIKLRPDYGDAYLNLIIALVYLGWRKAAKSELEKALQKGFVKLPDMPLGDLYSSLGIRDKAMETYQRVIDADPKDAYAHFQLGNLYSDQQEEMKAIRAYKRAIDIDPLFASAHNALGVLYDSRNQEDQAKKHYLDAIEADPEMALPHNNLGVIYDRSGETDEAISAYRRAIELDSSFALPHYNLGIIYEKLGLTGDAIEELEAAIRLDDTHGSSYEWLAFLYTKAEKLEDAVIITRRALELSDAPNRRLAASLAGLYKRLGMEAEHKKQLDVARKLPAQINEDAYQQACFEALCGNADEALRLLKVALDSKIKTPDYVRDDADFFLVKDDDRFQQLIQSDASVM